MTRLQAHSLLSLFLRWFDCIFADSVFIVKDASDTEPTKYGQTWAKDGFRSCRDREETPSREPIASSC